ncbi:MAG: NAD(P)H-binding protein [Bacteriovorax sp.]|nr:NAD(P)H-binding protein [Bacteriovorax sp.]
MKNIILAGSSGLVGGFALKNLLSDARVGKIILVSRTSQNISNPKIIQIICSLDLLDSVDLADYGVDRIDAGLCSLGSTIKKAGNKEAFKKVDKDFVINVAEFSKKFGSKQFAVISALGADSKSPFFYNQVKGEMEAALSALKFSKLTIIRPSLILGERSEVRGAERFLKKISPFLSTTLIGPLKKYRGIEAHRVAAYLTDSIFSETTGSTIIENSEMLNI